MEKIGKKSKKSLALAPAPKSDLMLRSSLINYKRAETSPNPKNSANLTTVSQTPTKSKFHSTKTQIRFVVLSKIIL